MDEQLKPTHKVIVVVDRANGEICGTLLRLNVEKPESSYAPVQKFANKKEDEKFQQTVYVEYKLANISIYLIKWILYMMKLLLKKSFVMSYKT